MYKKNILIISYTDLSKDPRPYKQIKLLKNIYNIDTIGVKKNGFERNFTKLKKTPFVIEILKLPLLLIYMYKTYYWDRYKKEVLKIFRKSNYDMIIVHEVRLVPLALKISKSAKIVLDAHEYSPSNFDDKFLWRLFFKRYYTKLCIQNLKKCDLIITVSNGIAELYKKNFNVSCEVITNAAEFMKLTPKRLDNNQIKIIHHGNASPSRNLELMIDIMSFTDNRFELYLMLVVTKATKLYYKRLVNKSRKNKKIHFLKPVKFNELIKYCNQFDIGMQFHPPSNLNLKYGLGNKFFEFIQSRLAIAIGPAIEMEKYVKKYNLGIISDNFDPINMADKLNSLNVDDIRNYKKNSDKYSCDLSLNENNKKLLRILKNLL